MSVAVDHNFPHDGDMLIVNASGDPIEGVVIRIFEHTKFFQNDVDTWVGETITDANGEWVDPIYLPEAQNWVVHFQKAAEYGPDHVEITT